jgi:hypothetical protein
VREATVSVDQRRIDHPARVADTDGRPSDHTTRTMNGLMHRTDVPAVGVLIIIDDTLIYYCLQ